MPPHSPNGPPEDRDNTEWGLLPDSRIYGRFKKENQLNIHPKILKAGNKNPASWHCYALLIISNE